MDKGKTLLEMRGITKVYGNGMVANDRVDFTVEQGEIHALMGENGAGKSTLMKVLFGIEQPDEGTITFDGQPVHLSTTDAAIRLGIGMVHQHFKLVPSLTIAENIVLGMEPCKGLFFDRGQAIATAKELAERFRFDLDPVAKVEEISVGKKQKVEILKAIHRNARLLILDEPTAVLTPQETEELFEQLQRLRDNGITIIFISHKLGEIKRICQRLTIMRAGRSMGTYDVTQLSQQDISRLMVGRDIVLSMDKPPAKPGPVRLRVHDLTCYNEAGKRTLDHLSLAVRSGQIVGVAGIEGSGQRELVELIAGMKKIAPGCGQVVLCEEDVQSISIHGRRRLGLSYIPEDRLTFGIAKGVSVCENLISNIFDLPNINGKVFQKTAAIKERVARNIQDYDIRCQDEQHPVGMLSGGNMQKVIVAREFSSQPQVLIADQPTRGVDVGAIEFIRRKLVSIRDEGCAVLLVSADLNEILELSDSVVILCQGGMVAYFPDARTVTEEELGYYMLGLKKQTNEEMEALYNEE